jgi:hypothetical protein
MKCICKYGYAENATTTDCEPCHIYCETCFLPNDPLKCEICKVEHNRIHPPVNG